MRVLVVEDEPRMAAALAKGLAAEGFVVDTAVDGPSGLEAARFGGYDAVLLDIMLPRMSGYTVVQTLRAEQNWVPVMLLSAKDGEYDQADGLDYGADDYLTKPFSFVVLLARLRAMVRRDPVPRATTLAAAEILLDPASRRVELAGEVVALSRREYLVLEHLLRAHPTVATKESLLDNVWGSAETVDPNVVEVYIGYLRRKLGRDRIETVRGVGYRLRA
ncbi:response regulator transcription factor [Pedococcus bigeumensis]|uniref:DNA-binding response regulator n=1 Tax=Pedococcus bigeumensis TaxID=433644 RepID=A0A502CPD1_9MICO|nr:response regulator transcription factor [Pedococcus bigeumensis]TPG15087.1 DNA-binding response regulator [Pedococcus bigeumensis]